MNILEALTHDWQSREEIERQVGGPCMSQLTRLHGEGRILHMVDASGREWVHRYCKPRPLPEVWVGKSHVGRLGAPVDLVFGEAAE